MENNNLSIKMKRCLTRYSQFDLALLFEEILNHPASKIIFDCSELYFIDIEIIKIFMIFGQLLKDNNKQLVISNLNWNIKTKLLKININIPMEDISQKELEKFDISVA